MHTFSSFMLDLETLGLAPDGAITQIGVCPFDLEQLIVGPPKTWRIFPYPTAKIDFSTVCWWMEQSDKARASVFTGERQLPAVALQELGGYFAGFATDEDFEAWAMPPNFDITLLETLYRQVGHKVPWKYNATRCLRTLCATAGISKEHRARPRVEHDAGADAEAQAITAIMATLLLRTRGPEGHTVSYVECVIGSELRQWRAVDHIEHPDRGASPPLYYPVHSKSEKVEFVVGDQRPHIFPLTSERLQAMQEHNPPGDELLGNESGPNY